MKLSESIVGLIQQNSSFSLRSNIRRLVVFYSVLASSLVSAEEDGNLEQVTLQLKWSHQFQFAGYYMAQELGFYEDEGINIKIRPGSAKVDVTHEVLSGRADFGVRTSSLLLDYADGKPVVVLGVIYQHSPLVLITRTDTPSNTIERVAEGPIMIEPHSGDLIAMLRRAGLPMDQLNILDHPPNALSLLESSKEAFSISAYQTDEPYSLLKQNISFNTYTPQTYGIDFYGDNFFTTASTLNNRRDLTMGFRRATLLGWEEAIKDPDKAISLILAKYPAVIVFVFLLIYALAKLPKLQDHENPPPFGETAGRLFKIPHFREGVLAQLFYVGAQITCWTYIIHYGMQEVALKGLPLEDAKLGSAFLIMAIVGGAVLTQILSDPNIINRAQAAQAIYRIGEKELALKTLLTSLADDSLPNLDQAIIVNTLMQMRETKVIPEPWKKRARQNKKGNPRLGVLADNLDLL